MVVGRFFRRQTQKVQVVKIEGSKPQKDTPVTNIYYVLNKISGRLDSIRHEVKLLRKRVLNDLYRYNIDDINEYEERIHALQLELTELNADMFSKKFELPKVPNNTISHEG